MVFRYYHLGVCTILLLVSLANGKPSNPVATECNCANDAVCIKSDNRADCYCLPEWQGERCDIPREYKPSKIKINFQNSRIDARNAPCSLVPNLCTNGGLCQYLNKNYSCACTDAYVGTRCQDLSPCNGYCFNNGICTLAAAAKDPPTCECDKAFYEGPRCNIRVTTTAPPTIPAADTTTSELCASYQQFCITGTCILESGRPKCQCPSTYTGEYCDTAVGGGVVPPATQGPIQTLFPGQTPGPGLTAAPPPVGGNCGLNPCRNNRPCYNNGNTYFCYCGPQYTGTNCEFLAG